MTYTEHKEALKEKCKQFFEQTVYKKMALESRFCRIVNNVNSFYV
nr:MAG TPA_asm: hypothetical protein [Caudoviricetes sp.]DAP91091.1 MAG TPA: hypothetical protein [Caudoviricetes sp.]